MEKKLRALIVDDEDHCIDTLRFDLGRLCKDWLIIVGEAKDVVSAMALLNKEKPDILFLDIDLPGMSGLQFLDSLGTIETKVIFTTAHGKYAIPAYKFKAEAFLLKPIASEELTEVVERLYKEMKDNDHSFTQDKLSISDINGITFVAYNEIVSCESNDNYCIVTLKDGTKKTVSKTLKYVSEHIQDPSFLRIHQSYLINTSFIRRYLKRDGGSIEMIGGQIYPVSKSYKESVHNYLHL